MLDNKIHSIKSTEKYNVNTKWLSFVPISMFWNQSQEELSVLSNQVSVYEMLPQIDTYIYLNINLKMYNPL